MNELKRQKYNDLYMDLAFRIAEMSHAKRLNVGCVIVKDNNIISFGWNGMPAGWDNNCEFETSEIVDIDSRTITPSQTITRPEVLHAEENSLMKLCRSTQSSQDASMYITHAPCIKCARLIHQAGIKSVFYGDEYRSVDGLVFLEKCGVQIEQV